MTVFRKIGIMDEGRLNQYDMSIKSSRERKEFEMETVFTEKKVYDAEDIQAILGIGRSKAYALLGEAYEKQEPFRVIKIGKLLRAPKQSFDSWLDGMC